MNIEVHETFLLCPRCNRKIYRTIKDSGADGICKCGFVYFKTQKKIEKINNGLMYNGIKITSEESMKLSVKTLYDSIVG